MIIWGLDGGHGTDMGIIMGYGGKDSFTLNVMKGGDVSHTYFSKLCSV